MTDTTKIIITNAHVIDREVTPPLSDRDFYEIGLWPSKYATVKRLPAGIPPTFVGSVWGARNAQGSLRYLFQDNQGNRFKRVAWHDKDYRLEELEE
jgi:hypothetical protein